jgi:hypothetical protein
MKKPTLLGIELAEIVLQYGPQTFILDFYQSDRVTHYGPIQVSRVCDALNLGNHYHISPPAQQVSIQWMDSKRELFHQKWLHELHYES